MNLIRIMCGYRERNFNKRLTSKILHIKTQKMSLNLQTDTQFFDHASDLFWFSKSSRILFMT